MKISASQVGERLKESRLQKRLTQSELAQLAGIGIVYLSEIERGIKSPSLSVFIKLLNALGASADYVLRYELACGEDHVYDELTIKLRNLTPKQRKTAADILDAYLKNI